MATNDEQMTVFLGTALMGTGPVEAMVLLARTLEAQGREPVRCFVESSGQRVDLDLRGSAEEVLLRLAVHPVLGEPAAEMRKVGPGRPKLGVTAREVSLLPRHWDWLATQPGGASAELRRLVEEARRDSLPRDRGRQAQEAMHRAMWELAGDLPGFEEACRSVDQRRLEDFHRLASSWPGDIHSYLTKLLDRAVRLQAAAQSQA